MGRRFGQRSGVAVLGVLAASAALVSGCSSDSNSQSKPGVRQGQAAQALLQETPEAREAVARFRRRSTLRVAVRSSGKELEPSFEDHPVLTPQPGTRFVLPAKDATGVRRARVEAPDDQPQPSRPAVVQLPMQANHSFVVRDEKTKLAIEVSLDDAVEAPLETAEGLAIYRGGWRGVADVVHRAGAEGTEDYLLISERPERETVSYRVDVSQVAGLRLVGNTLEFLSAENVPVLRMAPPHVIDARGERHEARLSVQGCAFDTRGRLRKAEQPVAPGAGQCGVTVDWSDAARVTCGSERAFGPCRGSLRYPVVYDPSWTTTGNMITARHDYAAVLTQDADLSIEDSVVLVAGGYDSDGSPTAKAEAYLDGVWHAVLDMHQPRAIFPATLAASYKILMAGGFTAPSGVATKGDLWDPTDGEWTETDVMQVARGGHVGASLSGGVALVAGGNTATGTITNTSEWYNPSTNKWVARANMNSARQKAAATLLTASGHVLVTGGFDNTNHHASAEYYDSAANKWTNTSNSMAAIRSRHSQVLLSDGRVLVAGGWDGTNVTATADFYDHSTKTFSAAPAMAAARQWNSMTLIPTDRVLVAGGQTASNTALTTAEMFVLSQNAWKAMPAMSVARSRMTGVLAADFKTVVIPGGTSVTSILASTTEFHLDANGTACTGGHTCYSGYCADGVCCSTACDTLCRSCLNAHTGITQGNCGNVKNGTDPANECSSGANTTCNGSGACGATCTSDALCGTGYYCSGNPGSCTQKKANGGACAADAIDSTGKHQCTSGYCVDATCCNAACTETCKACSAAKGVTNGTCSFIPNRTDPDNECSSGLNTTCNGAGTCGSGCDADSDCLAGNYCTGTTGACAPDKTQGTACSGDTIDATGTHQCVSGLTCVDGFCCNSACSALCQACSGAKSGGTNGACTNIASKTDPDNECSTAANTTCSAGACSDACDADADCNSTYFCNLATAKCTARQAKGQPCGTNLACLSALYCVDGYCCDSACTGTCKSCNGSKSGGANGTCTNIPNKTDPDSECSMNPNTTCNGSGACGAYCDADADCGTNYYCASGACTEKGDPTESCSSDLQCKSNHCIKGKCCSTDCQGSCADCSTGTCKARPSGSVGDPACSPHLCNGTALICGNSCNGDTQCASGYFCNSSNQCMGRRAQGQVCNDAAGMDCLTADCRVCASGHCEDGFCCNTACGGQCDACNGAARGWIGKVNGTCAIAPTGFAGDSTCTGPTCNGVDADCPSVCATDTDCPASSYCNASKKCVARKDNGQTCNPTAGQDCAVGGCRVCTSNNCVEGLCCNAPCAGACDSCTQSGVEGYCVNLAQGAPGSPSCSPFVCNGALATCPTSCIADVQCASGAWCDNGICKAVKQLGQTCSTASECASQFCVDGVCCASACVGACNQCDASGTCVLSTGPGSPTCNGILCDGSQADCPASCTKDAACADGYFCAVGGTCQPRKVLGQACNLTTDCAQAGCRECASNNCADGFCCNTPCSGGCDTCSATPGTCTVLGAKEIGLPPCSPYVCDGVGAGCPGSCSNDDVCAANAYCNGSACASKKGLGVSCTEGKECLSTFCADGVCCDKPCSGACDVCGSNGECLNAAGSGSPSCAPYLCTGAEPVCPLGCSSDSQCVQGYYCNGACTPKADLGQSCTVGSQCASGFCADSVCCNAACNGACDTCNLAGECVNVTGPGSPPCGGYLCTGMTSDCPTACVTDNQCADGYFCGTGGKCLLQKNPGQACNSATDCAQPGCRECVTGHCADGFCCDSPCDASCDECATTPGVCKFSPAGAVGAPTCEPFACTGAMPGCPDACEADKDCAATAWCKSKVCVKKASTGVACTEAFECLSNFCVDGVCCDKACAGQCEACDLPGSQLGNCSPVDGPPHGKREPCAAATGADKCSATTCKGTEDRLKCVFVGAEVTCVEDSCTDGVATFATVCKGTGKCPAPTTNPCDPFVCKGTACGVAPCASDDDCAPKFKCDSKSKDCISRDQSTCDGHIVTAADGKTSDDCSPYNCRVGPTGGECMTTCTSSVDCVETHVCETETEKCISKDAPAGESDDGGCGCRTAGAPRGRWSAAAFIALALGAMFRRRRDGY